MIEELPEHARAFMALVAHVEYVLRRNGYARKNQRKAQIDWALFAKELGEDFFLAIRDAGDAPTLIGEPPRAYHRGKGLQPVVQTPVANVKELFLRGVCQVRNNIAHGEKYVETGTKRDDDLVREAKWVLEKAIERHSELKKLLARP
jgi:hypothetical protein